MRAYWKKHTQLKLYKALLYRLSLAAVMSLLLLLSACDVTSGLTSTGSAPGTSAPTGSSGALSTCVDTACAASSVQVFVEPDAGDTPIVEAISNANSSVWVEVYLLTDHSVISALENAAARGVQVRVLLEPHPEGGGSENPQQLISQLDAAGVEAQASDPTFYYTHEKAMVIDGKVAYIMSCNLTLSGLGESSGTADRDYGVIDNNAADVGEVRAIFTADWNHQSVHLSVPRLVVSPVNSRTDIEALIAGAHSSLDLEDEEMSDTQSVNALIAAAHRGVKVQLVLPKPTSSGNSQEVNLLLAAGVQVRYSTSLYMHAKLIIVDSTLAFTGSENFSSTSLDKNRELGIIIGDRAAIGTFQSVFAQDFGQAQPA